MAKPKKDFHINVSTVSRVIMVWCDECFRNELTTIEGVEVVLFSPGNRVDLFIDPRYDTNEIAEEIKELLSAQVPEVFKE